MRTAAILLALFALSACSRTLPGGQSGPLTQERYACVEVDLGNDTAAVVSDTTDTATNVFAGSCGGEDAPDRVYLWTVPASGLYRISTEGSSFDTVLYLFNAGCSADELACSDDASGFTSHIDVDAEEGAEIVIVVDGFGEASGDYQLSIAPL